MTKDKSLALCSEISSLITKYNPVYSFTEAELSGMKAAFGKEDLETLRLGGLYDGDFEKFAVLYRFLSDAGLFDTLPPEMLSGVFASARRFDADRFLADPYIKAVKLPEVKRGDILLTNAAYEKGELFLYDAPDLGARLVLPKIGCFNARVEFPTVYEGNMPWMSVCPSEINSMQKQMDEAFGRCLVLGLGLGYYPFIISAKPDVESITIVELSKTVAELFCEYILPQFPHRDKITVAVADAHEYLRSVRDGDFDFVFADIWEGIVDGAPHYARIKAVEKRLPRTRFSYWIGSQIEQYLNN